MIVVFLFATDFYTYLWCIMSFTGPQEQDMKCMVGSNSVGVHNGSFCFSKVISSLTWKMKIFRKLEPHTRRAKAWSLSILPSLKYIGAPISAAKEVSHPFLQYLYESRVNNAFFGDLHRRFHCWKPGSLLLIPMSCLCIHQDDQSVFLPSYLPQDYFLFNLQFKNRKENHPMLKILPWQKTEMSHWDVSDSL